MIRISLSTIAVAAVVAVSSLAYVSPASAQAAAPPPPRSTTPNYPDTPQSTPDTCTAALGYLRRVYSSEIAAVRDSTQVWVTPICENGDSAFRTEGNAGSLRMAIASNDAMQAALDAKAFDPEDVVGVRMTGVDTAILYVLPFHNR